MTIIYRVTVNGAKEFYRNQEKAIEAERSWAEMFPRAAIKVERVILQKKKPRELLLACLNREAYEARSELITSRNLQ